MHNFIDRVLQTVGAIVGFIFAGSITLMVIGLTYQFYVQLSAFNECAKSNSKVACIQLLNGQDTTVRIK